MEMLLPSTIDLRVTSKCNLKCDFCFGTKNNTETEFKQWKIFLDKIRKHGVENLVITGGEPTLYIDLPKLINHSKKLGYKIILSTNGTQFLSKNILRDIDVLSIPLDGYTYLDCKEMRNLTIEDYDKTLKIIKDYKSIYPSKKLKIGTVLTKKNIYNHCI